VQKGLFWCDFISCILKLNITTCCYTEEETSIGADSISELEMDIAQTRDRSGSVNSRDAVVVASTSAGTTPTNSLENQLYDKYQARFFNPLHAKPNGEGVAPNETLSPKGILYDIEGKFAYSTYNEEMRSYHPMLDIKALTKDLK
jgi:hypothetical protein